MQQPNEPVLSDNLYEVPSCTICLQELVDNLGNLDCGHVFHLECITQNFDYRSACPNCQKRAYEKEVRPIHFPLTLNNTANAQLRTLLDSLHHSEQKQVELLLREVRNGAQDSERLRNSLFEERKELKAREAEVEALRGELRRERAEGERARRELARREAEWQSLSEELNQRDRSEVALRLQLDRLQKEEKDFEQMKKSKRVAADSSEAIVRYRQQLELKATPMPELFAIFYDMLLMKNLEVLKCKAKVKEYPELLREREFEITNLKKAVDELRREAKEAAERRTAERKKYEQLKRKFRALSERARGRGVRENEIPDMEESQGPVAKSYHLPADPVVQTTLRKPGFNSGMTIGGLGRKKDSKVFN